VRKSWAGRPVSPTPIRKRFLVLCLAAIPVEPFSTKYRLSHMFDLNVSRVRKALNGGRASHLEGPQSRWCCLGEHGRGSSHSWGSDLARFSCWKSQPGSVREGQPVQAICVRQNGSEQYGRQPLSIVRLSARSWQGSWHGFWQGS
jgi:hypothetical protein